jgi:hypothetical protein
MKHHKNSPGRRQPRTAVAATNSNRCRIPTGAGGLWDPVFVSAVVAAIARTWAVTIRGTAPEIMPSLAIAGM